MKSATSLGIEPARTERQLDMVSPEYSPWASFRRQYMRDYYLRRKYHIIRKNGTTTHEAKKKRGDIS